MTLLRGLIILSVMLTAQTALAAKHAFVVGNAAYQHLEDLQNTHADARAYGQAFRDLGYQVTYFEDLSLDEMFVGFDAFLGGVAPGDDVAFVFSGHGWSDGQTNYLVPTDAPLRGHERQLKRNTIALRNGFNGILDDLERAGVGLTVAIIDACRNNPFPPEPGRKSFGLSRGLAPVKAQKGSFVIFSAGEGQEALDRLPGDSASETLSVFTRSFIPHLTSGLYLEDAISRAQVDTAALAVSLNGHQQHPAYYDQTIGNTCLTGRCKELYSAQPQGQCDQLFDVARDEGACYAYAAFAEVCGTHVMAPLATSFLSRHCAEDVPVVAERQGAAQQDRAGVSEFQGLDAQVAEKLQKLTTDKSLLQLRINDAARDGDRVRLAALTKERSRLTGEINALKRQQQGAAETDSEIQTHVYGVDLLQRRSGSTTLLIVDTDRGAWSKRAGLRKGDIIIEAGGHRVSTASDLSRVLGPTRRSGPVPVKVLRGGTEILVQVKL